MKILDHDHGKYITTQEFNKLTSENFSVRLKEANLPTKNDIVHFIRKNYFDNEVTNIDKKVTSNKTRHVDVNKKLDDLAKEIKKYPGEIVIFS